MRVIGKALTFDDVLLVPDHSTIVPAEAQQHSHIEINYRKYTDSFCRDGHCYEAKLAIAIAQEVV